MNKILYIVGISIVMLLLLVNSSNALEFNINIDVDNLPYSGNEIIILDGEEGDNITGIYSNWLDGEEEIEIDESNLTNITINYLVPNGTELGSYTQMAVFLKGEEVLEVTYFYFNITTDIYIAPNSWDDLTAEQQLQLMEDIVDWWDNNKEEILEELEENDTIITETQYIAIMPNETQSLIDSYENERETRTRTHNLELQAMETQVSNKEDTISELNSMVAQLKDQINQEKEAGGTALFGVFIFGLIGIGGYFFKKYYLDNSLTI